MRIGNTRSKCRRGTSGARRGGQGVTGIDLVKQMNQIGPITQAHPRGTISGALVVTREFSVEDPLMQLGLVIETHFCALRSHRDMRGMLRRSLLQGFGQFRAAGCQLVADNFLNKFRYFDPAFERRMV